MAKRKSNGGAVDGAGSILSTVAGPAAPPRPARLGPPNPIADQLLEKNTGDDILAAGMPFNSSKPLEYGEAAYTPHVGETHAPPSPLVTASTSTETIASPKVGDGEPEIGDNAINRPLDRVRADDTGRELTTNQGVPVADNQNSLKAGLRGPTLMEDFILREKITHFDHERIPERVVHARGSAAHGYFESYCDLRAITRAAPFAAKGKRTPVFVRFSTVAGERGSADTVRDVRGFATKFYTEEGNWDLVGNNIPVFFIQDAMKFPDLVHAVKPEPHHAMPQASSAHDTFWDFASLSPEIAHMLLWHTSDRAIPRSYRMMQGFGVHSFRLVNASGASVFCKFHWTPLAGTHSLVWDEAVRLAGADPDYHRRDLWEAIDAGAFPEWELGLQIFSEEQAAQFPFDILDPTKIVPEEMVAVRTVGKLVLDRNPDYFFGETEQVAFCAAHVVPGIDFTNDPLLQGRLHSYIDTQISRLGGPNFHEIPINTPLAQIHNNQRDGLHRQQINRGRVNYEPNSLAGGCPFQAGARGFVSVPEPSQGNEVRGKPELFADHYAQARLFWISQSLTEQRHIINAFRFELTRVQTPAIRSRTLALLVNIDPALAAGVAEGLGMAVPPPLPLASGQPPYDYMASPSLSLFARPGVTGIRTRRVAVVVAPGVEGALVRKLYASLLDDGAVPRLVGARIGALESATDAALDVEISFETGPSVLWDGVVVLAPAADALAMEFVKLQYRHGKPLLAIGGGAELLKAARIPRKLPQGLPDPGIIIVEPGEAVQGLAAFKAVLAQHRVYARETDPPRV
ncbi:MULTISPECIES: catalase [unclassified Duganella]|uniref:catalase n=1 Tax=unclassified Duganella TaxID=2636909 RepID=UPI000891060E|nr:MULTISPECIES: catalase [unclassified Duganella]SDF72198.1 catalase [Duganella sp. OV458]SDI57215.1 catalase [Duganella sp. OV510]